MRYAVMCRSSEIRHASRRTERLQVRSQLGAIALHPGEFIRLTLFLISFRDRLKTDLNVNLNFDA